jgi:ABC-2 type transport system permease protein
MPVTRTKVVVHKSLALFVASVMAGTIVLLAVLAIREPIDLNIAASNLAAASLNLALLGSLFGAFAIFIGSIIGKRGVAIGAGAGVAVFMFLVDGLAPLVDSIAWMQKISPFYWYNGTGTLKDGLDPAMTALLAAVGVAFVIGGAFAFNRRDVRGS